jgi:hypothetical protein
MATYDAAALDELLRGIDTGSDSLQSLLSDLATDAGLYGLGQADGSAEPPGEFKEFDENIETEHTCPKCGYSWSGGV